jgi:hypothetical protein
MAFDRDKIGVALAAPDPVTDWMLAQPIWKIVLLGAVTGALLMAGLVAFLVYLGAGSGRSRSTASSTPTSSGTTVCRHRYAGSTE